MLQCNAAEEKETLTQFELEYFIQTRKEIDTEKQERNKILNYAIIATGAVSLLISKTENPTKFMESATALWIYYPLLLLISVLTEARRAKLRQIADRWFTLRNILHANKSAIDWNYLEEIVCHGLADRRYLLEDFLLHNALSLILYALILLIAIKLPVMWALYSILPAFLHLVLSCFLLLRRIPIPKWQKE